MSSDNTLTVTIDDEKAIRFDEAYEAWQVGKKLKQEKKHVDANFYYKIAAKYFQSLAIILEGSYDLEDKERCQLLMLGLDFPYKKDDDWHAWRYYDDLSILAYYQNHIEACQKAYDILITHKAYPASHHERIKFNGVFCGKNHSYKQLHDQICEIKRSLPLDAIASSMDQVTNGVCHFIYIKGYKFGIHHYVAVKAASSVMNFKRIHIYANVEADDKDNEWWHKAQKIPRVHVYKINVPNMINGKFVNFPQHQADIIRLVVLSYIGGVYHDLDFIALKDYSKFLTTNADVALVRETHVKLCNCFIAAPTNSKFVSRWLQAYETLYGTLNDWWGGLSVCKPHELAQESDVKVIELPPRQFLPFDYWHSEIFRSSAPDLDLSECYAMHLWDTEQYKRNVLKDTVEDWAKTNSKFYDMFKEYMQHALVQDEITKQAIANNPLKVIIRYSDNGRWTNKPDWCTRRGIFEQTLRVFHGHDVYCIADNVTNETYEYLKSKLIDEHHVERTSYGCCPGSFLHAVALATRLFKDTDYVYIVEDDYIHTEDAATALVEGLQLADYVTLYDHPDMYMINGPNPFVIDGGEPTKVLATQTTHWKLTHSTTMTFAMSMKVLTEDTNAYKMFNQTQHSFDFDMFCYLRNKLHNKRRLVTCIPGKSTHAEKGLMSPFVDWQAVYKKQSQG